MAANPTPEDDGMLKALAEDLADGCHTHEVSIGIKQNTEAAIRAAITGMDGAKMALGNAEDLIDAKVLLHQEADDAGTGVLKNCRLRLVKLFGTQYNNKWQTAGWPNGTTAIPTTQGQRFSLLGSLKAYFTATPASESADMDATAAICTTAHTAISDARSAMNTAEGALPTAKATEKAAVKALRNRVRGLIEELEKLIAEDDPRWKDFGLNIPANPSAPEGIETLTAVAQPGGKIHCVWTYSTRMVSTRLLTKRTTGADIDTDFISAGTTSGLEKTLEDFVPGVIVLVKAIAYNDGGDGPDSPTVSVTVT